MPTLARATDARPTTTPRLSAVPDAGDAVARPAVAPVVPSRGRLHPLGLDQVEITGGFWAQRQRVNATATLSHIGYWLEHEGWLANFDLAAAGSSMAGRRGREFSDSEVYKYLEAMAWELARRPDDALAACFEQVVARVAAAQEPDGYVGTRFGRAGQEPRYSDLEWGHELYCQGHLMQAAVARVRTGHRDDLLVRVAERSAHHVCDTFGPEGRQGVCGHAEVETALAELGRALDEPRFVEQAALFVERRGHGTLADIELGRSYYQDDVPVRDAEVFRGHAVRAGYLAAGAVDVAVERGDDELLEAVEQQWARTLARRTYLTGGHGSRHQDEGFGDDFSLPPDRAYSETCAGIASIMVSWRLLLHTGESRYADLVERTLYNVVATSPAPDGRTFYYANTLHRRTPGEEADPHRASARAESSMRAPWFEVSCCPPNVARTFAALATFCATSDDDGVQLHQYAPMRVRVDLDEHSAVELDVRTTYPAEGRVEVVVVSAPERAWTLQLRVPGWSTGAVLTLPDGERHAAEPGVVTVDGPRAGESVLLDLDLVPRVVHPDDRIDAVRGCVAVERGPEVLALESVDLPAGLGADDLGRVRIDPAVTPVLSGGRVLATGRVEPAHDDASWPYGGPADGGSPAAAVELPLVPYHDWATRGPSSMRVWIPTA